MRARAQTTETPEHREAWFKAANRWDALAAEVESFAPKAEPKTPRERP